MGNPGLLTKKGFDKPRGRQGQGGRSLGTVARAPDAGQQEGGAGSSYYRRGEGEKKTM